jgi:hypothetical protein
MGTWGFVFLIIFVSEQFSYLCWFDPLTWTGHYTRCGQSSSSPTPGAPKPISYACLSWAKSFWVVQDDDGKQLCVLCQFGRSELPLPNPQSSSLCQRSVFWASPGMLFWVTSITPRISLNRLTFFTSGNSGNLLKIWYCSTKLMPSPDMTSEKKR